MSPNDYTYISSPVKPLALNSLNNDNPHNFDLFYSWTPTISGSYGNWSAVNSGTLMSETKGYIARVPSSWTINTPFEMAFVNTPNNGVLNANVKTGNLTSDGSNYTSLDDNWNLIGNPYPSAIDYQLFKDLNENLLYDAAVHIWTHGSGLSNGNSDPFYGNFDLNYDSNDYAVCNLSGCTGAFTSWNQSWPAAQSYFMLISGNQTNANLLFNNSLRIPNNIAVFYKTYSELDHEENQRYWVDLIDDSQSSQILIGYNSETTLDLDKGFDAVQMFEADKSQLATIENGENYNIQMRGEFNLNDTVDLKVNLLADKLYKIAIHQADAFFEADNQNIYLIDQENRLVHNLSDSPYEFFGTHGTNESRFQIVYQKDELQNTESTKTEIWIYSEDGKIKIKSDEELSQVSVYAISGELILFEKHLSKDNFESEKLNENLRTAVVKIISKSGKVTSRKIIIKK